MSLSGDPALASATIERRQSSPSAGPAVTTSSSTFRLGTLAVLLVTLVWRAWTVSAWSWIQDDWIYQIEAQRMPLGEFLTQNYNQHFMPGQFLLVWATTNLAPLDYTWAVVVTVGLSVLSVLAWALALAEVFGENSRALLALALVALSPIFLPTSLWWAASIQVLPLQLAMALVILFLCRYLRRPGPRPLIGLGVSYALGLFFWQKALLLVIPAFFLVLLLGSGSTRARLRAAWRPLGLLATLTVLYLPAYLLVLAKPGSAGMGVDRTFSPRGLGESLSFFFTGLFNIVLPSLVGGPWGAADNTTSIYDPVPAVLWLPMLALAVCGAILVVRFRHRGGWLIAMVLTYAVVSWGWSCSAAATSRSGCSAFGRPGIPPTCCRSPSSPSPSRSPAPASRSPRGRLPCAARCRSLSRVGSTPSSASSPSRCRSRPWRATAPSGSGSSRTRHDPGWTRSSGMPRRSVHGRSTTVLPPTR